MGLGCYEEIPLELVEVPLIFQGRNEEASLLIIFLKDANSKWMGDLIGVEDEADVTRDMGVPGVAWDL